MNRTRDGDSGECDELICRCGEQYNHQLHDCDDCNEKYIE